MFKRLSAKHKVIPSFHIWMGASFVMFLWLCGLEALKGYHICSVWTLVVVVLPSALSFQKISSVKVMLQNLSFSAGLDVL